MQFRHIAVPYSQFCTGSMFTIHSLSHTDNEDFQECIYVYDVQFVS